MDTRSPTRGRRPLADQLAAATPPSRDRFVDLVRAVSIVAVVLGHWLMAVPPGRLAAPPTPSPPCHGWPC